MRKKKPRYKTQRNMLWVYFGMLRLIYAVKKCR